MNKFWMIAIIIVLAGHFVWFIIYAIRLLKDDKNLKQD